MYDYIYVLIACFIYALNAYSIDEYDQRLGLKLTIAFIASLLWPMAFLVIVLVIIIAIIHSLVGK